MRRAAVATVTVVVAIVAVAEAGGPQVAGATASHTADVRTAIRDSDACPTGKRILSRDRLHFEGPPPAYPPAHLHDFFTRCGTVSWDSMYVDDTLGGQGTHYVYGVDDMDAAVAQQRKLVADGRRLRMLGSQGWVIEAASANAAAFDGARVMVYGSQSPRIEALALALGAAEVTTVEYNNLTYSHARVTTTTPDQLSSVCSPGSFDIAMSISSIDHDGLGRYGDPLAPDGDLMSNDDVRTWLRPGGLLFLTVPVGPDVVVWNLHRRYGPVRLPLLLEGWDVVERHHWDASRLTAPANVRQSYEPVFVLRNPEATDPLAGGTRADPAVRGGMEAQPGAPSDSAVVEL